MTVETTTPRASHGGNGVTTSFSVPFKFLQNDDVAAYYRAEYDTETEPAPAEVLWVIDVDYVLTGAGDANGGMITATTPPPIGAVLTVILSMVADQDLDLPASGVYDPESVETAFDKAALLSQQLGEQQNRMLEMPVTTDDAFNSTFPSPEGNAGKILIVNATATSFEYAAFPTVSDSVIDNLALSNTYADTVLNWTDGTGIGMISDEFRLYIGTDTFDSIRIGRGDVRIRNHTGIAQIYMRRTDVVTTGDSIGDLLFNATITTGGGTDERVWARWRSYIVDDDETTMQGGMKLMLTDGYSGGETEIEFALFTPDDGTFNRQLKLEASITPSADDDIPDIGAIKTITADGWYVPLLGAVADGTYVFVRKIKRAMTLSVLTADLESGSATVALQKNGTNITNWNGLAVTTTEVEPSEPGDATANFAVGDSFGVVVSGGVSPVGLTLDMLRTFT